MTDRVWLQPLIKFSFNLPLSLFVSAAEREREKQFAAALVKSEC